MIEKAPILVSEEKLSPIVGKLVIRDSYSRGVNEVDLICRNLCILEGCDEDINSWLCRNLINVLVQDGDEEVNYGIDTSCSEVFIDGFDYESVFGKTRSYFREVTNFELVRLLSGLYNYYDVIAKDQADREVELFDENDDDLSLEREVILEKKPNWRMESKNLFQNWLETTMELDLLPSERRRLNHFHSLVLKRK